MPLPTHHTTPLTAAERLQLVQQLQQPSALIELGALGLCLAVAWALVRYLQGSRPRDPKGVWFGRGILDGALFPLVALGLTVVARGLVVEAGVPAALFRVALPILVSFTVIRIAARGLRAGFPDSSAALMAERSISWLAWGLVVLWITGLLPVIMNELDQITWLVGSSSLSLLNLIEVTLSSGLVLILALSVSSTIESHLLRDAGDNISSRKIVANLIRAALLTIGLMVSLSAAGLDLTTFSVLGGALGVGVGFGLQKLAANYVSGFVILAERSLRIGDLVSVDRFEGRITDIKTRYTVIRAANGRESIIPNEMLITQRVENATLADNSMLLTTVVQVAYGTRFHTVRDELVKAVLALPRILPDPGPSVALTAFQADGLELTVVFWIKDPENGQMSIRSDVNVAILDCLERLGVEIPYPQRVIRSAASA